MDGNTAAFVVSAMLTGAGGVSLFHGFVSIWLKTISPASKRSLLIWDFSTGTILLCIGVAIALYIQ